MSAAEFGALTPAEFLQIFAAWERQQKRFQLERAQLRYTIAVASGSKAADGSELTVDYFLPKPPAPKRKRYTGKQLMMQFIACLPPEWRPKD